MKLQWSIQSIFFCYNALFINGKEDSISDLHDYLEVIGTTQTSSIPELHNFLTDPTIEPSTQHEDILLLFIESLIDSNQLHTIVESNFKSLNMDTIAMTYKQLLIRHQYQVPSALRLHVLSEQMKESLWQWQREIEEGQQQGQREGDDYYHHHLPPLGSEWRMRMEGLIDTININSSHFHNYQVLQYEPQVFLWSVYRDTYSTKSSAFQRIHASPLYNSLWVRGLEKSKHYMHFRTRGMLSNPLREFAPFRNERYACHVS
jgi:hypothetical protein